MIKECDWIINDSKDVAGLIQKAIHERFIE